MPGEGGMSERGERTGITTEDVPRLIREAYPDGAGLPLEDPPGQAEVLAWIAREMRRQWRLDRLWILTVALPAKGLLVRYALRAPTDARRWFAAGAGVATLTIGTLRYLLRRPR